MSGLALSLKAHGLIKKTLKIASNSEILRNESFLSLSNSHLIQKVASYLIASGEAKTKQSKTKGLRSLQIFLRSVHRIQRSNGAGKPHICRN